MSLAVEIRGLRKTYAATARAAAKEAVKGVDLLVEKGSIFAILGPNGAGKSTIINILAGLVLKTSGQVRVCGYDLDRQPRLVRSSIGIVPQEVNVDFLFTAREILDIQAGFFGIPRRRARTTDILKALGLYEKRDSGVQTFSGGMKRRMLIAKALVHSPPVLVLDEPTAGVDIELRKQLWAYVRELNAQGVTILLTTHYLEEAEELSDHIAIVKQGRLVVSQGKSDLLASSTEKMVTITLSAPAPEKLRALLKPFGASFPNAWTCVITFRPRDVALGSVLDAFFQAGAGIVDITTRQTKLEDVFSRVVDGKQ